MTDTVKLKTAISKSGYRLRWLAEQLGLSYQGFLNKIDGIYDFRSSEIKILVRLLNLSAEEAQLIFFAPDVDQESTKEE